MKIRNPKYKVPLAMSEGYAMSLAERLNSLDDGLAYKAVKGDHYDWWFVEVRDKSQKIIRYL